MRDLTDNEKNVVKALIKKSNVDNNYKIANVLMEIYDIDYFKKDNRNGELYKDTVIACVRDDNSTKVSLYEALSLIVELIENRFLLVQEFYRLDDFIGEKREMYLNGDEHAQITLYNYSDLDLWQLLDSKFIATNALKNFQRNNYCTIEQQRHRDTIRVAKCSIIVAIIIGIVSLIIGIISLIIGVA